MSLELPPCDDTPLWDAWTSYYHFPTLAVADEIGIFPILDAAPRTADDVCQALRLSPRAGEALLGVVASLGFLVRRDGRFHLTEVARHFLLPTSPTYWGPMIRFAAAVPVSRDVLKEALLRDRPRDGSMGRMWEKHELDPVQARAFTAAMHSRSLHLGIAAARRVDFSGVRRLLDVGGGSGCFSIAFADRHPSLRCTVMELAEVAKVARETVAAHGLQDRVDIVVADIFRDPWPPGHDAAFFSNIYHDWDPARCAELTQRAFEALPPGGRIHLHELLLNDTKDGPPAAVADSMVMMLFTEGKQRTAAEFRGLLETAGFRDVTVTPTYGSFSVVSARR